MRLTGARQSNFPKRTRPRGKNTYSRHMQRLAGVLGSFVIAAACAGTTDPVAMDAGTGTDGSTDGSTDEGTGSSDDSTTTGSGADTGGPFPGCGADPGFEGVVVGAMDVGGVERRFLLVLPNDYDPGEALALVFAFHGRGSNPEQFRLYAGLERAASGQAVVVYPQGLPIAEMGGQTGWELAQNGHDVAFVQQLLDDLSMNLCIDPHRVYATGHSFGGYFSNTLGCALADRLRAIGPVAGGGPFGSCPDPMAAIVIHGIDDEVVPTNVGESSRNHWRSNNGCTDETDPGEPAACVIYQGCEPGRDLVWCLHDEAPAGFGTHMWPAFAGATIWSFFVGLDD
jgi:polyhydroxybutyrate depolymerase